MRFHIDIEIDAEEVRDEEGQEFSDLAEAREEAIQSLRDLIADQLRKGGCLHPGWAATVRDQVGNVVIRISARELVLNTSFRKIFFEPSLTVQARLEASAFATFCRIENTKRQIRDNASKVRAELLVLKQLTAGI